MKFYWFWEAGGGQPYRGVFSWSSSEELGETSLKANGRKDLRKEGVHAAHSRPSPVSFLPFARVRRQVFFAYCLHFLLSQSRAHDYIFTLYNHAVPFPQVYGLQSTFTFSLHLIHRTLWEAGMVLHATDEDTKAQRFWNEWLAQGLSYNFGATAWQDTASSQETASAGGTQWRGCSVPRGQGRSGHHGGLRQVSELAKSQPPGLEGRSALSQLGRPHGKPGDKDM